MAGVEFTAMSAAERRAACELNRAQMIDDADRRLVRALARIAGGPTPQISERQRAALWTLVDRYKLQIGNSLVIGDLCDYLEHTGRGQCVKAVSRAWWAKVRRHTREGRTEDGRSRR